MPVRGFRFDGGWSMGRSMKSLTGLVAGVLMMGVLSSCSRFFPGEADDDPPSPKNLTVGVAGGGRPSDLGYDETGIQFSLELSERDAETLGVSTNRLVSEEEDYDTFRLETRFFKYYGLQTEDVRPCMADDVVVTNLGTGEEFVVIEAGDCEDKWVFTVEGMYDYLIDAGACTGSVTLGDGREIETPCR